MTKLSPNFEPIMMKRNIYLEDIPLEKALTVFREALQKAGLWQPMPSERIPVAQANNRVTAAAVFAKISSPHYHASAMDGYALRHADWENPQTAIPLSQRITAGSVPQELAIAADKDGVDSSQHVHARSECPVRSRNRSSRFGRRTSPLGRLMRVSP